MCASTLEAPTSKISADLVVEYRRRGDRGWRRGRSASGIIGAGGRERAVVGRRLRTCRPAPVRP